MADADVRDSDKTEMGDAMNLTNLDNLAMLLRENAQDIAEIIKPIMQRYIGQNSLTTAEMELAQYIDDCVKAQEADLGYH